jgi:hypothetical protein
MMSRVKFVSAALIAAAALATPAMARERHVVTRHVATETAPPYYNSYGSYGYGYSCVPAPRVGAFATQPWTNSMPPCEPWSGY